MTLPESWFPWPSGLSLYCAALVLHRYASRQAASRALASEHHSKTHYSIHPYQYTVPVILYSIQSIYSIPVLYRYGKQHTVFM